MNAIFRRLDSNERFAGPSPVDIFFEVKKYNLTYFGLIILVFLNSITELIVLLMALIRFDSSSKSGL